MHIRPGIIDLKDITVKDVHGNTALLNGYVKHTFFKEPVFDFKVTQARNLLCYDVGPKQSPDWYGTIYGNGSATVRKSAKAEISPITRLAEAAPASVCAQADSRETATIPSIHSRSSAVMPSPPPQRQIRR